MDFKKAKMDELIDIYKKIDDYLKKLKKMKESK